MSTREALEKRIAEAQQVFQQATSRELPRTEIQIDGWVLGVRAAWDGKRIVLRRRMPEHATDGPKGVTGFDAPAHVLVRFCELRDGAVAWLNGQGDWPIAREGEAEVIP